ncbi:MAG: Wzz/FepE/Etk N-terminal domain-containing protein [bacterium]|nr:Wzz/FepE/Etk N-terminal domain-containing protein [bacterium]
MNDNKKGIHFLFKYRRLWLLSLIVGGGLGAGVSFFIAPRYLSTAIVYPYNSQARKDLVSNPQFGFEFESEQLMQLLSSKSMRDKTIEKFKLYDYYNLDTNEKSWNADLTKRYVKDVVFQRSKYLSVVVNVTMKDPQLAADIANFQIDEVDQFRASIFEENRTADLEKSKEKMEILEQEVQTLADSIYAVKGGTNDLLFNFIENLNNENYDPSQFVDSPELEQLIIDYRFSYNQFIAARNEYDTKRQAMEDPIPSVYKVDRAQPSYRAVSPSLTVNTMLGALAFFALVFVMRYLLEKWQQVKQEEVKA